MQIMKHRKTNKKRLRHKKKVRHKKRTIQRKTRNSNRNSNRMMKYNRSSRKISNKNIYSKQQRLKKKYIQALKSLKKYQYGGAFPKDIIDNATKQLQSKIQNYDTNTLTIHPNSGYFSTLTESSLEFIKKLNMYFLVMVLSFGNELFEKIIPNPEAFQNASIQEIKDQIFKGSSFFNVLMKTLSDKEFVEKWQLMFKEFYDKLVSPIVDRGVETLEGQIGVYEQVLKNMMYRFSKSVVLGLWDGISGALDIIPGAGTVIGVIQIVQLILKSVMSIIHSIQGPVKFIVDMNDVLGEIGKPLKDTILQVEDIYNSFKEIYDSVTAPIHDIQKSIQSLNTPPKLPS